MMVKYQKYQKYLIVAALVFVYLGSIWGRPMFTPDEFRYAEISREMIVTGDWILPRQLGMPYFEKPVMGYWLNALGELLCGDRPAAVRLFPALATLLSGGLIFLLCHRAGERQLAAVAPVIFLTTGLVFGIGTYGVLDAPFSFFLLWSVTAVYFAWSEPKWKRRAGYLVLAGVGCGCAFLTKGLLAVVLPGALFVPFLLWQKEWKRIFTLPWIPLIAAAAVAAPWVIAVHRADGDFWRRFLYVEHFQRAFSGAGAGDNRSQPFWFYIPVLLGGALPWLFFLPAMWMGCRARFREIFRLPLIRFASCMAGVWFFLFSASSGKLGTYILPCFPGLAILFGYGLLRYAEVGTFSRVNRALDWAVRILLPIPAVVFLVQTAARFTHVVPPELTLFARGENYFIPVAGVVFMLTWFRMAGRERDAAKKFTYFCIGLGFVMLAAHNSIPERFVSGSVAPEAFIRKVASPQIRPYSVLVSDVPLAAAAAWTLKRHDFLLFHKPGEFQYGIGRGDNARRFFTTPELAEKIVHSPETEFIILTRAERRVRELPQPKYYTRKGKFFVVRYEAGRERSLK